MTITTITTVLLDLDGVIRHFDDAQYHRVEREHGLEPGTVAVTAFQPGLIDELVTGQITRAQWGERIAETVGSTAAVAAWLAVRGVVDEELMVVVDRLRAAGVTVAVLTNGSDTVPAELAELGVADRFDALFNTAEIGVAKPDVRAFEHVCRELGVEPGEVFFTDDSAGKLAGAQTLGMVAELFVGVDTLVAQLAALAVPGAEEAPA